MAQDLRYLKETPSQTAGPYVHIGLTPNFCDISGVYEGDLGTAMINRIAATATVIINSTMVKPRARHGMPIAGTFRNGDVTRMDSPLCCDCAIYSPPSPAPGSSRSTDGFGR